MCKWFAEKDTPECKVEPRSCSVRNGGQEILKKGKGTKGKGLADVLSETESQEVDPGACGAPAPERCTQVPRLAARMVKQLMRPHLPHVPMDAPYP